MKPIKHCPSNECQIRNACTRANPEMCLLQFSLEKRIDDAFSWQNDELLSEELRSLGDIKIATYFADALTVAAKQRHEARADNEILRAACRAMKADLDAMTKERDHWSKQNEYHAEHFRTAHAALYDWQSVVEQFKSHDFVGMLKHLRYEGPGDYGATHALTDLFRAINNAMKVNDER